MTRFAGKVALISGAASGIGAAVAQRLAEEGATVVGCDLNQSPNGIICDVRDEESCAAVVHEIIDRYGALDILANIAGVAVPGAVVDLEPDHWRHVIEVNLTGTYLLSHYALPALLRAKGVIVNMASVAGLRATAYNAAYCASKGGVIMLTKSMAIELAKSGVRVNAVCPASVDTPFLHGFEIPDGADLSLLARNVAPMGRVIHPAEVAAAVAYLASDEAANISGTTLVIDGAASA